MLTQVYTTSLGRELIYEIADNEHRLRYQTWDSDWTPREFPVYLDNDVVSFVFRKGKVYELTELGLSSAPDFMPTKPRDNVNRKFIQQALGKLAGKELTYVCDDKRHLICVPYTRPNLHRMARELNIPRGWFHRDHYDIPKRRVEEIMAKCQVVSSKRIIMIMRAAGVRPGNGAHRTIVNNV
jgi:hypothetical protein